MVGQRERGLDPWGKGESQCGTASEQLVSRVTMWKRDWKDLNCKVRPLDHYSITAVKRRLSKNETHTYKYHIFNINHHILSESFSDLSYFRWMTTHSASWRQGIKQRSDVLLPHAVQIINGYLGNSLEQFSEIERNNRLISLGTRVIIYCFLEL